MSEHERSAIGSGINADGKGGLRVTDPELSRILETTAFRAGLANDQVIEKPTLDEALIEKRIRFGRGWQLKDERDRIADVDLV